MKTTQIQTNYWQNLVASFAVMAMFLLSSTSLLAADHQDKKAMRDDGVAIGQAEQTKGENTNLGNTEGGTDPSGPRDRDPGEIKTLSDRANDGDTTKDSQNRSQGNEKIPNAYSGADKKQ